MSKGEFDYYIGVIVNTAKEITNIRNRISELESIDLSTDYHKEKLNKYNKKIFAIKEKIWKSLQKQNL